jgi:signal transduction histidine kinase
LGTVLVPIFFALDLLLVPGHLLKTAFLRGGCTLYGLILLGLFRFQRAWVIRHSTVLAATYTGLVAWSIAAMCWLQGGYESSYYAGMVLVVVSVGLLFIWPMRVAIAFQASVYIFYLSPLLLGLISITDAKVAANNQLFLVSFIVITIAAQRHRYGMELRSFEAAEHLRQTQSELQVTLSRVTEVDRLKSHFFSNITHELRTPLTMILSPLESMLDGDLGHFEPGQAAYLKAIWRNAFRLLKLVNDLLDLVRFEERYVRLDVRRIDVDELLAELVQHVRPMAARKDVDLAFEGPPCPCDLHGDRDRIEQAIVNLMTNALKFTPEGGRVRVSARVVGTHVEISVEDNGIGIAHDKQSTIFERFSQADPSTTRRYGGTGIGLSLVREIATHHGGDATVESVEGEGSRFTVRFALGTGHLPSTLDAAPEEDATDDPTDEMGSAREKEPREWSRKLVNRIDYKLMELDAVTERRLVERDTENVKGARILVVDDNLEILRFIHLQLHDRYDVYLARDGVQGLELARRELPDVVVSDYMMPGMDGLAMLRAMRADPTTTHIPVIMLTARTAISDRLAVREAGADNYLNKPFSPRELRSAIDRLLERKEQQTSVVLRAQVQGFELLSAGLAHELSNPLSAVKTAWFMTIETLKRLDDLHASPDPDPKQIEAMHRRISDMRGVVDRAVERIGHLVSLIRHFSREGFPSTAMPTSAAEIVAEAVELVRPPGDGGPTIVVTASAEPLLVLCTPEDLGQAIAHLIRNALDAAGQNGKVEINTRLESGSVVISVQDDGPGISRENLPRVFAPFFTTKAPGSGIGIGLSIAQHVVGRLGGSIELRSRLGEGTIVKVRLSQARPDDVSPTSRGGAE